MNKSKNNWILKFILPNSDYVRTIYDNGLVFGKEHNEMIGILKSKELKLIKKYVNDDLNMLKREVVFRQRPSGSIIKINDTSKKHRSLKIIGWCWEKSIFETLNNRDCYYKLFD